MHKKIIYIVLFFSFCTVFNSCGSEDNSPSDQTNSGENNKNNSIGWSVKKFFNYLEKHPRDYLKEGIKEN